MSSAAPRFVFVPVSGPGGAGEYHRSLAVARALEHRWPECHIRFVLNRRAPYAADAPYEGLRIDDSPTRESGAVGEFLACERPDVVVFDSSGRLAQYRAARAAGAAVVYVSSRPKTRWKGFRLRRMRVLDQHWIAQPRFLAGAPGTLELLKLRLVQRPELVFLDTLHEPLDLPATRALQRRLGILPRRYVVLCPGGGGEFGHPTDAAAVFSRAAQLLTSTAGMPVVAVLGGRRGTGERVRSEDNDRILSYLPNGTLLGLVHDAAVAVVNGGSLLLQSMAQGTPIVAAPIAGDQADRIARCAELGCVQPSPLEPAAMARAATTLLDDEPRRDSLRRGLASVAVRNGADVAADAVARLLARRAEQPGVAA